MTEDKLDLTKLPHDRLRRRSAVLLAGIDRRVASAVSYVQEEYVQRPLFERCSEFAFVDLCDVARSDSTSLRRVWMFPWFEAQRNLAECLNQCFVASYKAAFDNCRRALELAVVGAYFVQASVPEERAQAWIASASETPLFSRAIDELMKTARFARMSLWKDDVKRFYWQLSDVVHTRGKNFSFASVQPSNLHFIDVSLPQFAATSLSKALDCFVTTVRHIATVTAIENPVLLFGFDLMSKFGLNPPLSGIFEEGQAARLRELLLEPARQLVLTMADADEEVLSVRQWFDGLPQISEEDLAAQVRKQNEWLSSHQEPPKEEDESVG